MFSKDICTRCNNFKKIVFYRAVIDAFGDKLVYFRNGYRYKDETT
jgi:hypothetical protein